MRVAVGPNSHGTYAPLETNAVAEVMARWKSLGLREESRKLLQEGVHEVVARPEGAAAENPGVVSMPRHSTRLLLLLNAMVCFAKSHRMGPRVPSHYTPSTMSYSPRVRA